MPFGLARRRPAGVSKWEPFEELRRTQERLNRLFEEWGPGEWISADTLAPLADIKEDEDKIVVTTDLPGVEKGDIDINIRDDVIEINAKCTREAEAEEEGYFRKERSYSTFSRALALPAPVTEEGAKAKLENGVLTVILPKAEVEKKKKIEIE